MSKRWSMSLISDGRNSFSLPTIFFFHLLRAQAPLRSVSTLSFNICERSLQYHQRHQVAPSPSKAQSLPSERLMIHCNCSSQNTQHLREGLVLKHLSIQRL